MKIYLTKRYRFQAVHSLNTGTHRERLHGHLYELEVAVENLSVPTLDQVIESKILARLQGQDLTRIVPAATGEMLVEWVHQELKVSDIAKNLRGVSLQETKKNRFTSSLSEARLV